MNSKIKGEFDMGFTHLSGKSGKKWQKDLLRALCETEKGKKILKAAVIQAIDKSAFYVTELKNDYDKLLGGYMPGWLDIMFAQAIEKQKQQRIKSGVPDKMYDISDGSERDEWRHRRPPVFEPEIK